MKSKTYLNRRKFLSQTAATGIGLTILPSLFMGGCKNDRIKNKIAVTQNPEDRGLVSLYEVDPAWPRKPENITWGRNTRY